MAISTSSAAELAATIIAAALQSGAIRLPGANMTGSEQERAKADGEYLATLLTAVATAALVL